MAWYIIKGKKWTKTSWPRKHHPSDLHLLVGWTGSTFFQSNGRTVRAETRSSTFHVLDGKMDDTRLVLPRGQRLWRFNFLWRILISLVGLLCVITKNGYMNLCGNHDTCTWRAQMLRGCKHQVFGCLVHRHSPDPSPPRARFHPRLGSRGMQPCRVPAEPG
jgi:hypothetical protein